MIREQKQHRNSTSLEPNKQSHILQGWLWKRYSWMMWYTKATVGKLWLPRLVRLTRPLHLAHKAILYCPIVWGQIKQGLQTLPICYGWKALHFCKHHCGHPHLQRHQALQAPAIRWLFAFAKCCAFAQTDMKPSRQRKMGRMTCNWQVGSPTHCSALAGGRSGRLGSRQLI